MKIQRKTFLLVALALFCIVLGSGRLSAQATGFEVSKATLPITSRRSKERSR